MINDLMEKEGYLLLPMAKKNGYLVISPVEEWLIVSVNRRANYIMPMVKKKGYLVIYSL